MENNIEVSISLIKKHSKALIRDVGVEKACEVTGRSAATLRRYTSSAAGNAGHVLAIPDVLALESIASFPYVTAAIAEAGGHALTLSKGDSAKSGSVNADVMRLASRFGSLMSEYYISIEDGVISEDEAQRLLTDTLALQSILLEMKQNLENEAKP